MSERLVRIRRELLSSENMFALLQDFLKFLGELAEKPLQFSKLFSLILGETSSVLKQGCEGAAVLKALENAMENEKALPSIWFAYAGGISFCLDGEAIPEPGAAEKKDIGGIAAATTKKAVDLSEGVFGEQLFERFVKVRVEVVKNVFSQLACGERRLTGPDYTNFVSAIEKAKVEELVYWGKLDCRVSENVFRMENHGGSTWCDSISEVITSLETRAFMDSLKLVSANGNLQGEADEARRQAEKEQEERDSQKGGAPGADENEAEEMETGEGGEPCVLGLHGVSCLRDSLS